MPAETRKTHTSLSLRVTSEKSETWPSEPDLGRNQPILRYWRWRRIPRSPHSHPVVYVLRAGVKHLRRSAGTRGTRPRHPPHPKNGAVD
ncbi:hypothetical protein MW887_000423 [Aspergillus wentii]|nr:hypothetical protein MW887_000423 [Aspergillus wentii]